MARILVLFAHPALEKSRVHRRLIDALPALPDLTFHDLYERYPAFNIDVAHEQALLTAHDTILFQHPLYWYSIPPLLKQWIDLVLEHGWAYGSQGDALRGKRLLNVLTTGGPADAYAPEGFQGHTLRDFLLPIAQTARLCKMEFLPPYAIQGTHRLDAAAIAAAAEQYRELLVALQNDAFDVRAVQAFPTLNAALERLLGLAPTVTAPASV